VQPTTLNAAEAEIKGFEIEVSALPVDDLTIELGLGYIDAEYTRVGSLVNLAGVFVSNEFAQIPEFTGNASVSYKFYAGGISLVPRVDLVHHSEVFLDAANSASLRQNSYNLVNASLTWESPKDTWQVRLAGTNLSDKRYFTAGFADLAVSGIAEAVAARGRQWSLQVQYRF
jgi:iron complex outermembrane recepter protein